MARNRPIAGQRGRARRGIDARTEAFLEPEQRPDTARPAAATEEATEHERPPGRPARSVPRLLLAAVLTLALVALSGLGLVAYRVRADDRVEAARDQALSAAQQQAVTVLSYDYRHLAADFAAARQVLTGSFARDYAATTRKVVRPGAEQYHAVVRAEVAAASVVDATADRVVVLLFVNQTTTSTRLDGPQVDLNRVRLRMVRVSGDWRISNVDAL